MSSFAERLELLIASGPSSFAEIACHLKSEWLAESLQVIDTSKFRSRKLPGDLVLLVVIGMALFRDRSIQAVISHLGLAATGGGVAPSAAVQARYRIGAAPLQRLFQLSAQHWSSQAPDNHYAGMRVLAIDGSHMRVADSRENDAYFGRPDARNNSVGAYPQLRLGAVLDVDSRLVVDAHVVPWTDSEADACAPLWARLPTNALVIMDRGFPAWNTISKHFGEPKSRHALIRLRANQKFECVEALPDGSYLSYWKTPDAVVRAARKQNEEVPTAELVRVVEYITHSGEQARLVTTLLDPILFPAEELVSMYAERWEIETSFDELKFHLSEDATTLRSEKPEGVLQEVWGYLTAYNLIRYEMMRVAAQHNLPPRRISFKNTFLMLQAAWIMAANNGDLVSAVAFLERQEKNVGLLVLPARRRRSYGRVVKIKMSSYPKKPIEREKIERHKAKKVARTAQKAAKAGSGLK